MIEKLEEIIQDVIDNLDILVRCENLDAELASRNLQESLLVLDTVKLNIKEALASRDDYIKLLCEELNELSGQAYIHGWRSSRCGAGEKARERMGIADKALIIE